MWNSGEVEYGGIDGIGVWSDFVTRFDSAESNAA